METSSVELTLLSQILEDLDLPPGEPGRQLKRLVLRELTEMTRVFVQRRGTAASGLITVKEAFEALKRATATAIAAFEPELERGSEELPEGLVAAVKATRNIVELQQHEQPRRQQQQQ